MRKVTKSVKNLLLKIGACICIALGLIGVFLPILPTTPFLILATVLSYNSSPTIKHWLLNHPFFGETIQSYLDNRAISLKALRSALITLWLGLLVSIWLVHNVVVDLVLFCTGGLVTIYLLRLKRIDEETKSS